MTNIYDPDYHFIVVQGAVASTFPHQLDVDTGVVMPVGAQPITDATRLWNKSTAAVKGPYYPRLLRIHCMDATPAAGSVAFVDVNSTAIPGLIFGFAADAANKDIEFSAGGIALPRGGFGVTIVGASLYMICFTWSEV